MLRVFKPSGEELLATQLSAFAERVGAGDQPIRALDLKRHLQGLRGRPRFQQRLLLSDGQILLDDAVLSGPMDVQFILLPFSESSAEQVEHLCQAAAGNDIPTLEKLLQRPQDPNLQHHGSSPLSLAVSRGSLEAVRLLLEAGADKDSASGGGITAMHLASWHGHVEIVRLLLEAKADRDRADHMGETPMSVASRRDNTEIIQLLRGAGEDS